MRLSVELAHNAIIRTMFRKQGDIFTQDLSNHTQVNLGFQLAQNYPNPFNPTTDISFRLPSRTFASLKIYDVLGREVSSLVSEELQAGNHTAHWDASQISSGVYFYQLIAGQFIQTKKMILMR